MYVSHNGLTEPLGRRQVLPYLVGLSARGWAVTLVSFEKSRAGEDDAVAALEQQTRDAHIRWLRRRYHNRPPVAATAFDVVQGLRAGMRLEPAPVLVHARSTVPAFMARRIARARGARWIFDLRGLLAQEYVDAGHWRERGWLARAVGALERRLLADADGLVVLTHAVAARLPPTLAPRVVIPCCVDTADFRPSDADRVSVRNELGLGTQPLLVYSGSLGSWYRLEEMLDFFCVARERLPALRLLILTQQRDVASLAMSRRGLERSAVVVSASPEDVPRYLAASDAGLCFLGRHASKVASSPTKYGEYLASGLPVVTNAWIGDVRFLAEEPAWLLLEEYSRAAYERAAAQLEILLANRQEAAAGARRLALREFALETAVDRYDRLYRAILQ